MDNIDLTITLLSVFFIACVLFIIHNYSNMSTGAYISTHYLYVYAELLLICIFAAVIQKYNLADGLSGYTVIAIFLLSFVSIFGIFGSQSQLAKHGFLLLLIVSLALPTYLWYKEADNNNILLNVLITLGVIVAGLSYYAYTQPMHKFDSWQPYLFTGLSALVIVELLDIIFGSSSGYFSRSKLYGYFGLIVFSGYLIHDTNKVRQMAVQFEELCKQGNCTTDFPKESLHLFLDVLNLFASLIKSNRA